MTLRQEGCLLPPGHVFIDGSQLTVARLRNFHPDDGVREIETALGMLRVDLFSG